MCKALPPTLFPGARGRAGPHAQRGETRLPRFWPRARKVYLFAGAWAGLGPGPGPERNSYALDAWKGRRIQDTDEYMYHV